MNFWEWFSAWWADQPFECDLPWWVLRRFVQPRALPTGSSLLTLGGESLSMLPILAQRGWQTHGVDTQTQRIFAGNGLPSESVRFVNRSLVLPEHYFNAILVRDNSVSLYDIAQLPSYLLTAQLLASLHPGGRLAILVRQQPTWKEQPAGHLRSCFERHFKAFPGATRIRFLGDDLTYWRTWNWLSGDQPRWGHLLVEHRIPEKPRAAQAWRQAAIQAAPGQPPSCCAWARRQSHNQSNKVA